MKRYRKWTLRSLAGAKAKLRGGEPSHIKARSSASIQQTTQNSPETTETTTAGPAKDSTAEQQKNLEGLGSANAIFLQTASFIAAISFFPAFFGGMILWGYFTQLGAQWALPTLSLPVAYFAFIEHLHIFPWVFALHFLAFIWMKILSAHDGENERPPSIWDISNIKVHVGSITLIYCLSINIFLAIILVENISFSANGLVGTQMASAICQIFLLIFLYTWISRKNKKSQLAKVVICVFQIFLTGLLFVLINGERLDGSKYNSHISNSLYLLFNFSFGILILLVLYWIDLLIDNAKKATLDPVVFVLMLIAFICSSGYQLGKQTALKDISFIDPGPIAISLKEPKIQGPLLWVTDSRVFLYVRDGTGGRVQVLNQSETKIMPAYKNRASKKITPGAMKIAQPFLRFSSTEFIRERSP